jgi:signal recognition particle receptor subunit beta
LKLSFLNYSTKEINFKIVYYGPGLSGKTTNIKKIYEKVKSDSKGKLVSLATETERTLFFDFFPLDLGTVKGYKVKFHLYTVPGQIYYSSSRKLIMKGVDGVVFVADSQRERFEANIESLQDMFDNLKEYNIEFKTLPYILQLNKRDLPNITPVNEMITALRKKDEPVIESISLHGDGVIETLKSISKLIMVNVKQKLK